MSREIKFRAWDEIGEWMGNVTSIDFNEGAVFIETKHSDDENRFDMNNVPVMQYTGLKDKNGKEIYEGDIINYSFKDSGEINTRVLEVYNDGTNFKTREIYRDYWLEKVGGVLLIVHGQLNAHKGKTQYLTDISCSSIYSYEIIGNIYENPELLEVTT